MPDLSAPPEIKSITRLAKPEVGGLVSFDEDGNKYENFIFSELKFKFKVLNTCNITQSSGFKISQFVDASVSGSVRGGGYLQEDAARELDIKASVRIRASEHEQYPRDGTIACRYEGGELHYIHGIFELHRDIHHPHCQKNQGSLLMDGDLYIGTDTPITPGQISEFIEIEAYPADQGKKPFDNLESSDFHCLLVATGFRLVGKKTEF